MGDRPGDGVSELNPLAEVRQARMAGIIWDEGFARVTDLAGRFGVSAVTIRADLTALEARARVRRVRGGAVPPSGLLGERPFESSQWEAPLQKSSIGVHAAGMIAAGDTVILDVGTTTTAIARALVLRTELHDVTVVTNGLNIALELERATPRISVVVTGGTLRPSSTRWSTRWARPCWSACTPRWPSSAATASTPRSGSPTSTCPRRRSSGPCC